MSEIESDHNALREAVNAVLDSECSLTQVRKLVSGNSGLSAALWQQACDLGWVGVAAPEAYGGSGLDFGSLATIYEQLGSHLAPISFLQTQLCIEALSRAGTDQQKRAWLERLVTGSARGSVSMLSGRDTASTLSLTRAGSGIRLNGTTLIADDACVQFVVVFARDGSGSLAAVAIDRERVPVDWAMTKPYDGTRALATASFNGCEVSADAVLAEDKAADQLQDDLIDHAAVALACDSVGGAFAAFDLTIAYLNTRSQFGRLIGSFQALKHRCATLKVGLEASRAMLSSALEERKAHSQLASAYASLAKFHACDMYVAVAAESIQLHGGIGFTWECPCHLFLKRAKFNQALFGESSWHQDRAARRLLSRAA